MVKKGVGAISNTPDPRQDIPATIADIETIGQRGQAAFHGDRLLQAAVLYRLQIIGEAAGRRPPDLRARYPRIPWRDVIGFRNIAVHQYHEVDLDITWEVIDNDIPALKQIVADILRTEYGGR